MNLLSKLPSLPFTIAFDILFRHGGFAAFVDAHHGRVSEASYQFWRVYFISSPAGKLYPSATSLWVEVMCTCFTVQSLPHPAHCVYLLRPVCNDIPESANAWSVAREVVIHPHPETLIRAMKIFLSGECKTAYLQREWFCVADVCVCRSLEGWLLFAEEVISHHFFTRNWWMRQREGPFCLLSGEMPKMSDIISYLSKRECAHLMGRLIREETGDAVYANRKKMERKQWLAALPSDKKAAPKAPKSLTPKEKEEINRLAGIRYTKLISIATTFKLALQNLTDENLTGRVVYLTAALCNQYPRIKWSLRREFHERMVHISTWDLERELYRFNNRKDKDALSKLKRMALI